MTAPALPEFLLVGTGGHGRSVLAVLRAGGHRVAGAVDRDPALTGRVCDGLPILGTDDYLARLDPGQYAVANGIGNKPSAAGPDLAGRRRAFESWQKAGFALPAVISPQALVMAGAAIGPGTVVMPGAIIQTGAAVGSNVIVNTGAIVEHHAEIGDHCHIAPGALLCGGAVVEAETHIGARAVVLQLRRIGSASLLAAGAVATRSYPPGSMILRS